MANNMIDGNRKIIDAETDLQHYVKGKKIIIGNIAIEFFYAHEEISEGVSASYFTPLQVFENIYEIYKKDFKEFRIETNNPQLVEVVEVLYTKNGEESDIELYYQDKWGKLIQLNDFQEAYDYLGEPYDIIDAIRVARSFNEDEKDVLKLTSELIKEKKVKWIERLGL